MRLVLLFLLYSNFLSGQLGIDNFLATKLHEPNVANVVEEYDGGYILGGKYSDDVLGRWDVLFAKYDHSGNLISRKVLTSDTTGLVSSSNKFIRDSTGFMMIGYYRRDTKFVKYDPYLDTIYVNSSIYTPNYNIVGTEGIDNESSDSLYLIGYPYETTDNEVMIMRIVGSDTLIHREHNPNDTWQSAKSFNRNSRGDLIIHCGETDPSEVSDYARRNYVSIYDKDLNLKFKGIDEGEFDYLANLSGSTIDSYDHTITTGWFCNFLNNSWIDYICYPSLARYKPDGRLDWIRQFGYNIENRHQYGKWESVIESKEKDGYIVVGGVVDETEFQGDTLRGRAAIAKISYEGDSLWTKTYTFRTIGHSISERFTDVILSKDGHYIVCGTSASYDREDTSDGPWHNSFLLILDDNGNYDPDFVSTLDVSAGNELSVYPNPVRDKLVIGQSQDVKTKSKIFDIWGRKVDGFDLLNSHHHQIIDVSTYQSGQYFIVCKSETGEKSTTSFVVD